MSVFANQAGRGPKAGFMALGLMALGAALAMPAVGNRAVAQDAASETADGLSAEQVDSARSIFNNFSCGACHVLGDAGATGQIGPSLDGNRSLDHGFVVSRVANGQGAMPGFAGQIADEDIDLLATYIIQVKK